MNQLHFPWLEFAIVVPLVGAAWVGRQRSLEAAHRCSLWTAGITLVSAVGAWQDFTRLQVTIAHDRWDLLEWLFGYDYLVIDALSAPLLPLAALLYLLTLMATLRTKIRRFSFAWTLLSESLLLATLSCREPWVLIGLLAAGTIPPYVELRSRQKPTRVYALHMALFVILLVGGGSFAQAEGTQQVHSLWAVLPLLGAVLLRSGIVPVHCWMTDLFEHATFGTALLFVTPMVGAYAAVRLVLPIAPDWVLRSIGLISLTTAVYAAGMALVQHEARRFFCYLFLSHSSLVLMGLESVTTIGLTGGLCVWLSVGLALGGFGLTLRALESRTGRLSLDDFHGLYDHMPTLAVFFLLTGLASVGFPGTFGFIGTELLVDGVVQVYPSIGMTVVVASALNGIAVLQAYLRLFTGARHAASVSLRQRPAERWAVLILAGLILGGGIFPQPGVRSRHRAAEEILSERAAGAIEPSQETAHAARRGLSRPTAAGDPKHDPLPD